MDTIGIGTTELVIIAVLALLVVGPERIGGLAKRLPEILRSLRSGRTGPPAPRRPPRSGRSDR